MRELILGGVKSGKSRLAERRAVATGLPVIYVATAEAGDDEMRRRIERHRSRRPAQWSTVEVLDGRLAGALADAAGAGRCLLVDCLTLWLTALIDTPERLAAERGALLDVLDTLPGRLILVSNEVGMGVVPMGTVSRRFVDEAGRLHQDVAARCERVTLVAAGLPLTLKDTPE